MSDTRCPPGAVHHRHVVADHHHGRHATHADLDRFVVLRDDLAQECFVADPRELVGGRPVSAQSGCSVSPFVMSRFSAK